MSRYYYYWLYVYRPSARSKFRCVARIIARRIEETERYSLYKEQGGMLYLCVNVYDISPYEEGIPRKNFAPREKFRNIRAVYVWGWWAKDRSREELLARLEPPVPKVETMHEMRDYDS